MHSLDTGVSAQCIVTLNTSLQYQEMQQELLQDKLYCMYTKLENIGATTVLHTRFI
jgi:uncharacterized coiled-coil protein SlyX